MCGLWFWQVFAVCFCWFGFFFNQQNHLINHWKMTTVALLGYKPGELPTVLMLVGPY